MDLLPDRWFSPPPDDLITAARQALMAKLSVAGGLLRE
jgi:hypothetical protein